VPKTRQQVLKQLGLRLRELRFQAELTQEEMAARLRILVPNYAKIEQGKVNCTVESLRRLAVTLGVEISDLFTPPSITKAPPGRPRTRPAK
jgi:transcriptional regulator with XRE-family HTH domain